MDYCLSADIGLQRCARQGCNLSPFLFNILSATIFEMDLAEGDGGIKINGKLFHNFKYADNTVITTDSIEISKIYCKG